MSSASSSSSTTAEAPIEIQKFVEYNYYDVERDSRVISALRLQESDNVAVDAKPSMVVCVLVDSCNCIGHAKDNLREFICGAQMAICV